MKKILLIFLSFLLLFNSSGYILLLTHLKIQFRREIRQSDYFQLHKKDLIRFQIGKDQLNIDNAEFFWEDENEFEYQGRMYDVVLREETDNDFILYCVNDIKEENLSSVIKQTGTKADPVDSLPLNKILVKKPLIVGIPGETGTDNSGVNGIVFFGFVSRQYSDVNQIPDTPPPRLS